MSNKIDWNNTTIISKLSSGDIFYFLHRRQSKVKGREWMFIKREGKNAFYKEKDGKEIKCIWNREVIKK